LILLRTCEIATTEDGMGENNAVDTAVAAVTDRFVDRVDDDHDKLIGVASDLKHMVTALNDHIGGEEQMMKEWKVMLEGMNGRIESTHKCIEKLTYMVYGLGASLALFVGVHIFEIPIASMLKVLFKIFI
jgi:hypothetical protein